MKFRTLALMIAMAVPSFGIADEKKEHPYKKAKVGDSATYVMKMAVAGQNLEMTMTQTVTKKDDKEATVKIEITGGPAAIPAQEMKVDLTKDYDPTASAKMPGVDVKTEKVKDGTEKIKVNGKEYDTTWETYKISGEAMGIKLEGDMKVWSNKDIPLGGMVKTESKMTVAGMNIEQVMELKEVGKKSD
jgi:glucan-binding YG repeat protein